MTERFLVPDELKIELYPRRDLSASFDRMELALELVSGKDGIGAIVRGFILAIQQHDAAVKAVEDKWLELEGLKKDFNRKNRTYRNFDSAWNTLLDNQAELDEYIELAPRMVDMEERIKRITDAKAKVKAESDYRRFLELEPRNSKLHAAQISLASAQERRDAARSLMQKAEQDLVQLRETERKLAAKITDDHIVADERKVSISEIFPNVKPNNVLVSINDFQCENEPYNVIIKEIAKQKSPHLAIFRRYDYRFDPFRNAWFSLQDLRDGGVCIDDPMVSRQEFVALAAKGDFEGIKAVLIKGEDPNATDFTGVSPIQAAAANNHTEIVELLFRAGASVNTRDRNMMTPLLSATIKGNLEIVRQLVDCGAEKAATDRNMRTAAYFSIQSGNTKMTQYHLLGRNVNEKEAMWGYSPLHSAANMGDLDMIKCLLKHGASIYTKDNRGLSPEGVAYEAGFTEAGQFLANERFSAPGQLVFTRPDVGIYIWVGDYASLEPKWSSDAGVTEVLCLPTIDSRPTNMQWLTDDETCKHYVKLIDVEDDDKSSTSWEALEAALPSLVKHITDLIKRGGETILICDPTGNSTSITLLAIVLLLQYQIRVADTLADCGVAKPNMKLSLSMRRGLENFQRTMDEKKLKRLAAKVRKSVIISNAF